MRNLENAPLLEVSSLAVTYGRGRKAFTAVSDISFSIETGQVLGLVGESGSGKSTIGKAILGLEKASAGSIRYMGQDITHDSLKKRKRTAAGIRVVFQDPYSSLNPDMTVGETLIEPLVVDGMKKTDAMAEARIVMEKVGLGKDAVDRFPKNFSGGQRQRIAIARALIVKPKLIVLDEPVSALDLSTQAQVLNLLADLSESENVGFLFVAHDLDVVRFLSDEVIVLYKGRIMEQGQMETIISSPKHPYTKALLAAAPVPNPNTQRARRDQWKLLQQQRTQSSTASQGACMFASYKSDGPCDRSRTALHEVDGTKVACHFSL